MTSEARIRIDKFIDKGTFEDFCPDEETTFITGTGRLQGRKVFVFSNDPPPPEKRQDPYASVQKLINLLERAESEKFPVILFWSIDRQQTRKASPIPANQGKLLADNRGVGRIYGQMGNLSGIVPIVSVVIGKIGAAISFPVAQSDVAVMLDDSGMSIGRPDAVKQMTGEISDFAELAGAKMHCSISGTGDVLVRTEEDAFNWVKRYLSYFPDSFKAPLPTYDDIPPRSPEISIEEIIPASSAFPFDMNIIIKRFVDDESFLILREFYAKEVITGLARLRGRVIGVLASNSKWRSGALYPESCRKMSRFISICDSFGIPLVFLADVPGFMVGKEVEQAGSIKAGALLFSTIANATVPRICVVVRKAFTAGLYAMSGPGFSPDAFYAFPGASISVYGRKILEGFARNRQLTEVEEAALREMIDESENPILLRNKNLIDDIVNLENLRDKVFACIGKKRKKTSKAYPRSILNV